MFNQRKIVVYYLIIIVNTTLMTSHNHTYQTDGSKCFNDKFIGVGSMKSLLNPSIQENEVEPARQIDEGSTTYTVEMYNVTFTDINGEEVRIILNRTVIDNVESEEQFSFDERAREDAYVKNSAEQDPYSVLIMGMKNNKPLSMCTGSLLTEQWILTAAHCSSLMPQPDELVIYAGGYSVLELLKKNHAKGSQVAKTKEFYSHPLYHPDSYDADISVVKAGPFEFSKTIKSIKLSTQPWTYHSYKQCSLTGYGIVQIDKKSKDGDGVRKTHNLFLKNPCICSFKLKMLLGDQKTKRYICTKPLEDHGGCPGDSGGGLICDGQVKGVAMQIMQMRKIASCDLAFFPPGGLQCGSKNTLTIFQDTCPFLRWINQHVKLFNDSEISPECVYTSKVGKNNPSFILLSMFCFVVILTQYIR